MIVPTRGAARGLRRGLLVQAQNEGVAGLLTPEIRTPSYLLDLGVDEGTVATPTHRLIAWVEVFLAVETSAYSQLFPEQFKTTGFRWALQMGQDLIALQDALGEGGFSIASAVPRVAETSNPEARRWDELAALEALYLKRLASMGLLDPVAARWSAHLKVAESLCWERIVLLGVADPPRGVDALLHGLAEAAGIDVEVVVGAPESMADDFDLWGRPLPEKWGIGGRPLPLQAEQIHLVADPAAEARLVEHRMMKTAGDASDEVVIGLADPEIAGPLTRELEATGREVFDPDGSPFRKAPKWGFLQAFGDLLDRKASFEALQRLARYPTVAGLVPDAVELPEVLVALDEMEARRVPVSLDAAIVGMKKEAQKGDRVPVGALGFLENIKKMVGLFAREPIDVALAELLATLEEPGADLASPRVSETADRLDHDLTVALCERAAIMAQRYGAGPDGGNGAAQANSLKPSDRYAMVLTGLALQRSYRGARPGEVQLHGWLDLLWSASPHALLAGANEGNFPESVVGHIFLPDSLRRDLGLRDNEARLSRDRFLLELLLRSRADRGQVDVILAKTDSKGDPLKPSRLLFSCPDEELPGRVRTLFGEPFKVAPPDDLATGSEVSAGSHAARAPAWSETWKLQIPYDSEQVAERTARISPTVFRDYLACPFYFYLKRVLQMEAVTQGVQEMEHRDFGNLCHKAFEEFGRDENSRHSVDAREIGDFLIATAESLARLDFGDVLPVPVQVQMESVRQRLLHAARVQARERAAGWVIEAVEFPLPGTRRGMNPQRGMAGTLFLIGDTPLTGIIDRIERNEKTGAVRVIDYKTSSKEKTPEAAHLTTSRASPEEVGQWRVLEQEVQGKLKNCRWIDLQLPLYAAYLGASDPFGWGVAPGEIAVGYFNLPLAVTRTAVELWQGFDDRLVRSGMACAETVLERIGAGVFWPPEAKKSEMWDFARLFPRGAFEDVDPSRFPNRGAREEASEAGESRAS